MTDTAFNTYGNASDVATFLVKQATGNAFRHVPEDRVAHSLGFTVTQKGRIPYIDANGEIAWMTAGAANTVVAYDTNGLPVASGSPSAYRKIESQTVSSPVTQVVFDDISTEYEKIILCIINGASDRAAVNDPVRVQVSSDNGATFKTASGDYNKDGGGQTGFSGSQWYVPGSTSTFKVGYLEIELAGLGRAACPTSGFIKAEGYFGSSTGTISQISAAGGAIRTVAEADTAFRVVPVNGTNFTAGTFEIYGVLA